MQLGESHIALRKINVFLEYFPGNEMGLYTKAEILFELEQYDQSLQSINQSLNIEACAEKEDFKNKIIDRVKKN